MGVDNKNLNNEEIEKSYIVLLKEAQESVPGVVLPSMGMLDNEVKVEIDGKEYLGEFDK